MNYREHVCPHLDEMGEHRRPQIVTCGICGRSWCERCDPCPSALCVFCHGPGSSTAPVPPRQVERERTDRARRARVR